ncbi:DNA-directed RNA polymerase subunit alpha [Candidatus Shapirobacteria bacterium CG09_land_8_20_14_0_10_49_15]|uniref:DNA-directed RNA polymerase subunit alpha n=2 Tax=Candidatus Shapironibacteriota TaxID=1752721 RepID=A0A2M8L6X0_9BACT|nr:MAG: DNA-directed RNA polymerase subunit alpha [Candidatus Shapirobacteria bacterium CG09_land_8_20_14_0_10_49_15]PJE69938.1 MAG: DNA-directed RNA polymerase subunit alpha [Candidatus Shapirobacteria bacterium CG10_big_fil_rev_8_21_14_0_10_48_15]
MISPNFQIKKEAQTATQGRFAIEPLQQGYGHTLGNALRRVLLSSLPGAAITEIKITGIRHKFSTLEGLKQDIIELILNLKEVRFAYTGKKPVKLLLEKSGPGVVTAGDIKASGSVRVVNPELVVADLASRKNRLKIQLTVSPGYGYSSFEQRPTDKIGVIPIDAIFSPVQRVNYWVEATRVGRKTNWDKLVLEIDTDGTIKPQEALKQAGEILVDFFGQVVKPKKMSEAKSAPTMAVAGLANLTLEELELPTRIINALRKGNYGTVGDLQAATAKDLTKVKNLGSKSIEIVIKALKKKGVSLKEA